MPKLNPVLLDQARVETFHNGQASCLTTREGGIVAIYAVTDPSVNQPYPVLGAIIDSMGRVYLREWTLQGRYDEDLPGMEEDLVEISQSGESHEQ